MTANDEFTWADASTSHADRSDHFVLGVSTSEASGPSGAGARAGADRRPRSDSDLRLTVPALGSHRY